MLTIFDFPFPPIILYLFQDGSYPKGIQLNPLCGLILFSIMKSTIEYLQGSLSPFSFMLQSLGESQTPSRWNALITVSGLDGGKSIVMMIFDNGMHSFNIFLMLLKSLKFIFSEECLVLN